MLCMAVLVAVSLYFIIPPSANTRLGLDLQGGLEIVYPKRSIRVDPPVAVVDTNVDRKASRHAAEAYLGFLYSPEGRAIIAKHHLRPWGDNPPPPAAGETWPAIETFDITFVAGDWNNAMKKFFGEGGVFDAIYQPQAGK